MDNAPWLKHIARNAEGLTVEQQALAIDTGAQGLMVVGSGSLADVATEGVEAYAGVGSSGPISHPTRRIPVVKTRLEVWSHRARTRHLDRNTTATEPFEEMPGYIGFRQLANQNHHGLPTNVLLSLQGRPVTDVTDGSFGEGRGRPSTGFGRCTFWAKSPKPEKNGLQTIEAATLGGRIALADGAARRLHLKPCRDCNFYRFGTLSIRARLSRRPIVCGSPVTSIRR